MSPANAMPLSRERRSHTPHWPRDFGAARRLQRLVMRLASSPRILTDDGPTRLELTHRTELAANIVRGNRTASPSVCARRHVCASKT